MKERLDRLAKQIQTAEAHRHRHASPIATARTSPTSRCRRPAIAVVADGAAGLTGDDGKAGGKEGRAEEKKKEEPKKRGFGLGALLPTGGGEQKSAQVSASGGTRGVDPETRRQRRIESETRAGEDRGGRPGGVQEGRRALQVVR